MPSVPIAIRQVALTMDVFHVPIGRPIRRPRSKLVQAAGLTASVQLAKIQTGVRGILVIFDADDDCPKEIVGDLQHCAAEVAHPYPCGVVLATKEFETFFVAAVPSLLNRRGITNVEACEIDPDTIRDAKGWIERRMEAGRKYSEVTDQPALTAVLDWRLAYEKSRSCRKFVKEVRRMLLACGLAPTDWAAQ